MKRILRILSTTLALLFLAIVPVAQASATRYVNGVSGNDSNNCMSSETACKTIGHAISLASSGDSIIVAAGTYPESLGISTSLNVTGSSASTTIIDGQATDTVVSISSMKAQVILSNVTIRNGGLGTYGGGIYNSGTLTIVSSVVSGNLAGGLRGQRGHGGGIYNSGRLTINNTTISGNRAGCGNYCSGQGGGIFNDSSGSLIIENSSITGNSAGATLSVAYGGGIYNSGRVAINNSTVGGNTASFGQGGGIYNNTSASMGINNTTISGNTATQYGKGDNLFNVGAVVIQNSIVANGVDGNCYAGVPITSNGYNLSSDGTCNFNSRGDLNNHDPLLGPLQNNGGPTETMALLPGSPAIDAGNPAGCTDGSGHLLTTDQRGMPRPDTEDAVGCDVGAYERQSD